MSVNPPQPLTQINTHHSVNGFAFGCAPDELINRMGKPDEALQNYTGEWELLFGDVFYRFFSNRMVEATCPESHYLVIDGEAVPSVFDYLARQKDVIDAAKFRISLAKGMAYDYRNSRHGSLTIFERGRWDALVGEYRK